MKTYNKPAPDLDPVTGEPLNGNQPEVTSPVTFYLFDHLGNTRVTFRADGSDAISIIYAADYYPYGKILRQYNCEPSRYLSTHHERDKATGYDNRGARLYDSEIGRFLGVDPHADQYPSWSPYNYVYNNPLSYIDPDGRDGIRVIDKKNKTITIKATYFVQTEDRVFFRRNGKTRTVAGYSSKQVAKMNETVSSNLNSLGLAVNEGEYKGYSLQFDLEFKEGGTVEQSEKSAVAETLEGHSVGNSLTRGNSLFYPPFESKKVDNGDGTESSVTVGGLTLGNQRIMMNTSQDKKKNRLHEIFHTFGFTHPKGEGGNNGIMAYPPEKVNQADANQVGNSSFLPAVIKKDEK